MEEEVAQEEVAEEAVVEPDVVEEEVVEEGSCGSQLDGWMGGSSQPSS